MATLLGEDGVRKVGRIGAGADPVPAVQSSDVNHGDIISKTQSLDGAGFDPPAPGKMYFSITLPSGRPFMCSPFDPGARKDMMKAWLDAVTQAYVNDGAEAIEEARYKSLGGTGAGLGARLLEEVQNDAGIESLGVRRTERTPAPEPSGPSIESDPGAFAKAQLSKAKTDIVRYTLAAQSAAEMQKAAEAALAKWSTICAMLDGTA